ncbi:MAG: phosphoribosylaminoimidazolesuccinocarboxamide synthase, partial [Candidatus Cloacimonetes bacterium]|nr:phosphoribosylaminoimidazolesuccinocarboxamide synthase [Candidatus Cloacimonadota bacterium]
GKILTQIARYFFERTGHLLPNHLISCDIDEFPQELQPFRAELQDRSMLVKKTRVLPFECIARGYITGSAWKEFTSSGTVHGKSMPPDLQESQRFPEPIFTPSTKAEEGHDINISFEVMNERMDEHLAKQLRDITLNLFAFTSDLLREKGIIIADTKLEFGSINGEIYLIDEIFTPDSSRFWDADSYSPGRSQESFDKQFVRDYISSVGWDKTHPAPVLSPEIIKKTYERYITIYKRIVGNEALEWDTPF